MQVKRPHSLRIPVTGEDRELWQARLNNMAILRHLGASLCLHDDHVVRLTLEHRTSAHYGGLGTSALNGAMIAGMIDCAMSVAGILHFRGRTCGTVQLSIQFMKPVRSPCPIIECYAIRKASNMLFLNAQLLEEDNKCSVLASGIVGASRLKMKGSGGDGRSNWFMPAGMNDEETAMGLSTPSCDYNHEHQGGHDAA